MSEKPTVDSMLNRLITIMVNTDDWQTMRQEVRKIISETDDALHADAPEKK